MADPAQTGSTRRRSESSRRAILTAAFELAGEVGFARLSIEAIAARAGVGKQTIYRWWPSKGAVLFDAFLLQGTDGGGEPQPLPDTGDLEADLKTVMRATVAELTEPSYDVPMRTLTTEILNDTDLAEAYAERLDGPMRQRKLQRLRSAQDAGQIRPEVDLEVVVDLLFGSMTNRWLFRSGPLTADYADALVEQVLDGITPAGENV